MSVIELLKLAVDTPEIMRRAATGRSCPHMDRARAMHVIGVVCRGTLTVVSTGERVHGKVRFSDGGFGVAYGFAMALGGDGGNLLLTGRTNTARESFSNDSGPGHMQPPDTMFKTVLNEVGNHLFGRTGFQPTFVPLPYKMLGCDRRTTGYLVCTSSADNRPVWDFDGTGPSVFAAPSTWELRETVTHRPLARLEVGASDGHDEPSLLFRHDLEPPRTRTLHDTLRLFSFYLAPVVRPVLSTLTSASGGAYNQCISSRFTPVHGIRSEEELAQVLRTFDTGGPLDGITRMATIEREHLLLGIADHIALAGHITTEDVPSYAAAQAALVPLQLDTLLYGPVTLEPHGGITRFEGRSDDIYHLLEREGDTFVLDLSFLRGYERKAGVPPLPADASIHLRLGETGFVLQDHEPARVSALLYAFREYTDVMQHAVLTHTLLGAGVTLSSRAHLPHTAPLRRALAPTELATLNSVGRGLQVLFGEKRGFFSMRSLYTYPALKQMTRDFSLTALQRRVERWSGPVFAPHLRLSEHEVRGDTPLRLLHEWHTVTRSFAERVVAMDTAYGTTDAQRRAWVAGAGLDPDTCGPVDLLAATYMNTLFHNLLANEAHIPPAKGTSHDAIERVLRTTIGLSGAGAALPLLVPTLRRLDADIFGRLCDDLDAIVSSNYPMYVPSTVEVSVGF